MLNGFLKRTTNGKKRSTIFFFFNEHFFLANIALLTAAYNEHH